MLQRLQSVSVQINTKQIHIITLIIKIMCAFSLSIIIDSRVKIIGNERTGASPCDPRGRLHANKSIVLYNIRLHIPCSYFAFSLGFFYFLFHAEAANRKQTVNIATRGTTGIRM